MDSESNDPRQEQAPPAAPPPIPKKTPTPAPTPTTPPDSGEQETGSTPGARMQVRPHEEHTKDTKRKIAELDLELPLKLLLACNVGIVAVAFIYPVVLVILIPLYIVFAFVQFFRCTSCIGLKRPLLTISSLPPDLFRFVAKLMAAGLLAFLFILFGMMFGGSYRKEPFYVLTTLAAILEGGVVWWALQDYVRDFVPHRTPEK